MRSSVAVGLALACASCVIGESATAPSVRSLVSPVRIQLTQTDTVETFGIGTAPLGNETSFTVTHKPIWLSVDPMSGTLGDELTSVTARALITDTLDAGTFVDTIVFTAEGLAQARTVVDLHVDPDYHGVVQPLSATLSGPGDTTTLVVSNTGHGAMRWELAPQEAWVHVSTVQGEIGSGRSDTVRVYEDTSGAQVAAGSHEVLVRFAWGAGNGGSLAFDRMVPITAIIPSAPLLTTSDSVMPFIENQTTRLLQIASTGNDTAAWSVASADSWLSVSPASGSLPVGGAQLLTVTADRGVASAGQVGRIVFAVNGGKSDTVAVDVGAALPPNGDTQLLGYGMLDAAFAPTTGTLVTTSIGPSQLRVLDVSTGVRTAIDLPHAPKSVAITPDGATAVVGSEDGTVMIVDVAAGVVTRTVSGGSVWDVLAAANGYAYSLSCCTSSTVSSIEMATGTQTQAPVTLTRYGVLAPGGAAFYAVDATKSFERWDISSGVATRMWTKSPNVATWGGLWISEDGTRLMTSDAIILRATATQASDLVRLGRVSGAAVAYSWTSIAAKQRLYGLLSDALYVPSVGVSVVRMSDLSVETVLPLPELRTATGARTPQGWYVFADANGRLRSLVLDPQHYNWGLSTLPPP